MFEEAQNRSLHLDIKLQGTFCYFELTGDNLQITEQLPFPNALIRRYQEWQQCYLSWCQTKSARAKVIKAGSLQGHAVDWQRKLDRAEDGFVREFDDWLRNLHSIQDELLKFPGIRSTDRRQNPKHAGKIWLYLTCHDPDQVLVRLPWENWYVVQTANYPIHIFRSSAQWQRSPHHQVVRDSKPRILAILGDDTHLTLESDQKAMLRLKAVATVECMSWRTLPEGDQLRSEICHKLEDPQGWDVLFFAGHSQDFKNLGGELSLAPGVSISIAELSQSLEKAQSKGLRFAIFNSCNGFGIALKLLNMGLSQVVAMREPIHNQAAQVFLEHLVAQLRSYQPIDHAFQATRDYLKAERLKLDLDSTYLIPSLFCHPEADLFQFQPLGIRKLLRPWRPSGFEWKILGLALLLSLPFFPIQNILLNGRILTQYILRQFVYQESREAQQILVQIDDDSLLAAELAYSRPLDRTYLAKLTQSLVARQSKVIGWDYAFDYKTSPSKDQKLMEAIQNAVKERKVWFVFAAQEINGQEIGINGKAKIADLNWSLQGNARIEHPPFGMETLDSHQSCEQICPFSTVLAMAYRFSQESELSAKIHPSLTSQSNLRQQMIDEIDASPGYTNIKLLLKNPIQHFLKDLNKPINDFSISPSQVYTIIPSSCLIKEHRENVLHCPENIPASFAGKIVLIAAGNYPGSGEKGLGDSDPAPWAYWLDRWLDRLLSGSSPERITGGEEHSYMTSQLLNQHFIFPIPDYLGVLAAALLGKSLLIVLRSRRVQGHLGRWGKHQGLIWVQRKIQLIYRVRGSKVLKRKRGRTGIVATSRNRPQMGWVVLVLGVGDLFYVGFALQLYFSATVLLPVMLPVFTLNAYMIRGLMQR